MNELAPGAVELFYCLSDIVWNAINKYKKHGKNTNLLIEPLKKKGKIGVCETTDLSFSLSNE